MSAAQEEEVAEILGVDQDKVRSEGVFSKEYLAVEIESTIDFNTGKELLEAGYAIVTVMPVDEDVERFSRISIRPYEEEEKEVTKTEKVLTPGEVGDQ